MNLAKLNAKGRWLLVQKCNIFYKVENVALFMPLRCSKQAAFILHFFQQWKYISVYFPTTFLYHPFYSVN